MVLSFGVGEDVSFDQGLIEKYHCTVLAFDPTPRSIDWVKESGIVSDCFRFYPYGISDRDGELVLYPPPDPTHVSFSVVRREGSPQALRLPVKRLSTIIKELGISRIDILKMDIEASEYDVIPDLVKEIRQGLEVDQVLIEFHHRFEGKSIADTRQMIRELNGVGLYVFSVEKDEEFSFIRRP